MPSPSGQMELAALGTLMQLQPNTTRSQFKVAYERLSWRNNTLQAIGYAPAVLHAERALFESTAQAELNDTTLVIRDSTDGFMLTWRLNSKSSIHPEYFPVAYMEPINQRTRVRRKQTTHWRLLVSLLFFFLSLFLVSFPAHS